MSSTFINDTRDLLGFLIREGDLLRSPVFLYSIVASASRTGMIYAINETAAKGLTSPVMGIVLIGSVFLSLFAAHLARVTSHEINQDVALKMRKNLSEHLLAADVGFFQRRHNGEIFTFLTGNVGMASGAIPMMVSSVEALVLLILCMTYMFLQSWPAGIATLVALLFGLAAFYIAERPAGRLLDTAHRARVAMHETINDMLRGYRELRLRHARREAIADRVDVVSTGVRDAVVQSERIFSRGQMAAQASLAFLLVSVVLLVPLLTHVDSVVVLQILTVVLFTFGPVEALVANLPAFARSAVAFRQLTEVLDDAAQNPESETARRSSLQRKTFQTLEFRGITTTLRRASPAPGSKAADSFTLGPIDLMLRPGQSVFITGGNGMGKSTLLQILTGLRHPDDGEILLDGVPVTRESVGEYRSLFGAVFSEFYLFRHLYGLSNDEREKLQTHIEELGLAEGVSVTGDAFDSLSLSTGQMRRLALSITLAEERPIIILDEFAADQDPTRRAFFYDVLVPRLARQGHAVIAVTHDEHCFHKSDRLIRMKDGKIESDTLNAPAPQTRDTAKL